MDIQRLFQQTIQLSPEDLREFLNRLTADERSGVEALIADSDNANRTNEPDATIDHRSSSASAKAKESSAFDATLPPESEKPVSSRIDQTLDSDAGGLSKSMHEQPPKSFGDYDLLEEIARGGMGVVYKARHRQLNRIVALKMILSGQFASKVDVARFHLEAEASAKLDHPGITPIFDIGEINGQPYFAMKLIEGGSVAEHIEEFEKDFRKSARLVMAVSQAIHHAHQRGILHRDLKPNNILLDENQNPLVTDFGLAKITSRDSKHTQTGAIMGTPAYMAPEQAGTGKSVTTAADIYSLGAILYRLLTGQPTYQADSALDIVMMSQAEDPKAPRSINHAIPIDLELICLKCLQRDAKLRYHSAADLTDDLNKWLNGEPVSVRAASMGTLASAWMKQNLQMAGGAAIVGIATGLLLALVMYLAAFSSNFNFAASTYQNYFPQQERPWMAIPFDGPDWLFPIAMFGWPSLIALCGFVTVIVTRPASRNAAASAGMIAGVFCGGLMGMMGTIGPLMTFTSNRSAPDIQSLANAAFGDEQTAMESRKELTNRYPDLLNFPEQDRGALVRRKIQSDIIVGLPSGLWSGMAMFMTAVPLVVLGAIFTWTIRKETSSLWFSFVRYIDVAFAFCLLASCALIFFASRSIGAGLYLPGKLMTFLILGSLALSLVAAMKRWPVLARIPIHVFWIVFLTIFLSRSLQAPYAGQFGQQAVLDQDYDKAVDYFEMTLQTHPNDLWNRICAGILCLKSGDVESYRQHCREVIAQNRTTRVPGDAERSAKFCLILPDALDDISPAIELSKKAVELGSDSRWEDWFLLVRAMAEFRQGNFQACIEWVDRIDRQFYFVVNCTADMVKAMSLHQLGDAASAKSVFEFGNSLFEKGWREFLDQNSRDNNWVDRMIFEFLRDEAQQMLVK